jgi:hypothetical protein
MFIVVFRNRKRADIDADAYAVDAARMERLARTQLGFVSFKSHHADDGEVLALSEWESEEAALGWRGRWRTSRCRAFARRLLPGLHALRRQPHPHAALLPGRIGAGAASAVTPFAALADRR